MDQQEKNADNQAKQRSYELIASFSSISGFIDVDLVSTSEAGDDTSLQPPATSSPGQSRRPRAHQPASSSKTRAIDISDF